MKGGTLLLANPSDAETADRIAEALEAIAAAETHKLWDYHLTSLAKGKNEKMFPAFQKAHPCPRCSKK
jgi:hypothetical protein